ncbi:MAG TPA: hypothetical protein VK113_10755 [Gemmatimonadales bacterium]|nr:hypothetical protein [Gemmatimonadales bacterium]
MRHLCLFLLVLSAACQTEARRLLVVDLTLADPLTLEATAAPWHAVGYRVEYRRYYPHLTRQDLDRYRTVVVLGGREPEGRSDALTIGDLAILAEWIRRDGVVVLGYAEAGGALDRWIMNQWLAAQGAGIAIGTGAGAGAGAGAQLLDATPLPHSALDNAGFAPFPAGRNYPLQIRDRSQTLARASGTALVAASRVQDGLIVVASRSLLASADADARARDFLVALARWTRRPAEWASIGAATRPALLRLADGPQQVTVHAPPRAPPAGAAAIVLPQPASTNRDDPVVVPSWINRQGMRVLWSRFTLPSLDSLLGFVEVAALNALATTIPEPAVADTESTRNLWKITADRLQATSLRWFPAISLFAIPSQGANEVDRHGNLTPIACGLDSLYWRGAVRPTYRTLARLGGTRPPPEVIAGVALDLDSAMSYFRGSGFCDADYRAGLAALGLDRAEMERLAGLPPPVRYDTLLERGWLSGYFEGLEAAVAERAVALRGELRRLRPDLRFAFHASEVPADWFTLGLLRGFSSPDAPVLLWLKDRRGRALLRRFRERNVFALSAVGLRPDRVTFAPSEWPRLRFTAFSEHAGFWLDGAATDSLGRLIRRFTK